MRCMQKRPGIRALLHGKGGNLEEKDPQVSLASGDGTVTFYITRHGQTVYNVASRVQGWCDSQLTDEGIRVAHLLGRGLAEVPFAQAYCSDAGRAVQTLNAVLAARAKENPQAELPFIHVPDPRLREWCYGNLEAGPGAELHAALTRGFGEDLPFDELNRRLPQVAEVLADQDDTGRAERFDQVKARLESFFSEAGKQALAAGGGNVLVVTHSFVVRSVMYLLDPSRVNDPLKDQERQRHPGDARRRNLHARGDGVYPLAGRDAAGSQRYPLRVPHVNKRTQKARGCVPEPFSWRVSRVVVYWWYFVSVGVVASCRSPSTPAGRVTV